MPDLPQFSIRDQFGNMFGPASADTLREWVQQGRILPGMAIAPEGTPPDSPDWIDAAAHPLTSDLLAAAPPTPQPATPQPTTEPALGPGAVTPVSRVPQSPEPSSTPSPRPHPYAIATLVTGILSCGGCCCCFIPLPIVGVPLSFLLVIATLVLAALTFKKLRTQPQNYMSAACFAAGLLFAGLAVIIDIFVIFSSHSTIHIGH